jgi:hypothetical protein
MHRGTDWPLYEFATEREVAKFFWSGMSAYGVASSSSLACRALLIR